MNWVEKKCKYCTWVFTDLSEDKTEEYCHICDEIKDLPLENKLIYMMHMMASCMSDIEGRLP